jgi:uncharacterized protein YukE
MTDFKEQAFVDPEKLAEFAGTLKSFSSTVDKLDDRLLSALGTLSRSWQDQEFDKFKQHLKRLNQTLLVFIPKAEGFAAHLTAMAEDAKRIHRDLQR